MNVAMPCVDPKPLMALNPYPPLGCPVVSCWPRGFPLSQIVENENQDNSLCTKSIERKDIGVLQSLADHDPDVDAIFRLTLGVPFSFDQKKRVTDNILMLPKQTFSPFNAQVGLVLEIYNIATSHRNKNMLIFSILVRDFSKILMNICCICYLLN